MRDGGFVLGNRLINPRLTSRKQYARAVALVAELTGVAAWTAQTQLLRAIYDTDSVSAEQRAEDAVPAAVARASTMSGVVPLALFLAECEATRGPDFLQHPGVGVGAAGSERPAMGVVQAARQLQQRTFPQAMRFKYGVTRPISMPITASPATASAAPASASPPPASAAAAASSPMDTA